MDYADALDILARYVPSGADLDGLLTENAVTRTVLGVGVTFYDPYAAAAAYLMHPDTVVKRTAGSWTEEFVDPLKLVAWLEGRSIALRLTWPPADPVGGSFPDLTLDVRGW